MSYDLEIRFDVLAHTASRLDQEHDTLSDSPTSCLVSAQEATSGFPAAFNGSLFNLADEHRSVLEDLDTVAAGIRTASDYFELTEEDIAASARHLLRESWLRP
ncbi:hypothetical protein [Actinomyces wuliandei]|uniref:hypothetical protein n=1 Tax=Actinomyces wuliandei TaxID=2057743 RepID=UPI000FDC11A1|nr:hypothetical protein [Actinomyces wuliandei]